MRILLIPSKNNYPKPDIDSTSFAQAMPYLAAVLKEAGHEVFGLNLNYVWCQGSAPLTLERLLTEAVHDFQPDLIGISGLAPDYLFVKDVIFFCRRLAPHVPVVIGGGIITYDSEFIFKNLKPDFGIIGEGELAIKSLADHIESELPASQVPSLMYWENGNACTNSQAFHHDLDSIPFPDYRPFDFESYLDRCNHSNNYIAHTRLKPRILPISFGRSCPFNCTFCCHFQKMPWRMRSIDNIINEIISYYELYHFNILYIHDELMFMDKIKGEEFCNRIIDLKREYKADFDWGCYLRVNDAKHDILRLMKAAGCKYIGFGLESASDVVLKSMNKRTNKELIRQALTVTQDVGIGLHGNFIFGDPVETHETIKETSDFYDKYCKDLTVYMYYVTPYPGSRLFEDCQAKGILPEREEYYTSIAYNKNGLNMTTMSEEQLRSLVDPLRRKAFKGKKAVVTALEISTEPSPDIFAPFELRRHLYSIKSICPHCENSLEYLFPLRIESGVRIPPIIHFCTNCHLKILLDVQSYLNNINIEAEDEYDRFYSKSPYISYHPFIPKSHSLPAIATPVFLRSHAGFNIIEYDENVHGVAQSLGALDITKLSDHQIQKFCEAGTWLKGKDELEVIAMIDSSTGSI